MKVVRESLYESYDEIQRTDEGWKDVKNAVTKPFRKRTPQEAEAAAMKILSDQGKLQKIVDALKANKNQMHLQNYIKAKKQYDAGNKQLLYNYICFILDNWGDFKNGNPVYYQVDPVGAEDVGVRTSQNGAARKM